MIDASLLTTKEVNTNTPCDRWARAKKHSHLMEDLFDCYGS